MGSIKIQTLTKSQGFFVFVLLFNDDTTKLSKFLSKLHFLLAVDKQNNHSVQMSWVLHWMELLRMITPSISRFIFIETLLNSWTNE